MDMHNHAGSTLHKPVTLTFNLLTSESMHSEVLTWSMCIKFGVDKSSRFPLTVCKHTHRHTASNHLTQASATAGVVN